LIIWTGIVLNMYKTMNSNTFSKLSYKWLDPLLKLLHRYNIKVHEAAELAFKELRFSTLRSMNHCHTNDRKWA